MSWIPEIINEFNAYEGGEKLLGITGQVQIPSLQAIKETMSGGGILGEYETASPGQFASMKQELPFRMLYDSAFGLMSKGDAVNVTLRGSQQVTDTETAAIDFKQIRVVERGRFLDFEPGKLEQGKQTEAKVTYEVLYLMIEIDGKCRLELDKLNSKFVVDGRDMLAKVRAYS